MRATYNTTYSAPVVPSVQVLYELRKNITLRASVAKGFRSPSLKELYLEFDDDNHDVFGNKLLIAEKSNHYHASIDWKLKKNKFTFTISPSAFYNDIRNKISLVSHNDIYTYLNFYEYITRGGQLTASVKYQGVELSSGYSYTGINNSEVSAETGYLYASEVNTMLQYKVKKTGTLIAIFWKYNGRQPQYTIDENDDVKVFNGESYNMADGSITQQLFKNRFTVSTGVKNILNVTSIKNQDPSGGGTHQASEERVFTGMGRNVFVRLQYQFSK